MNERTSTQAILQRVDAWPEFLSPLRRLARRYLEQPGVVHGEGFTRLGPRPRVAEQNYALTLFPALPKEVLEGYGGRFGIVIPKVYADFLSQVNGLFFLGMSLCGAAPSMLAPTPRLDRGSVQCQDLSMAVARWAREYRVPDGYFHFGGRSWSYEANVGYFIDGESHILSVKRDRIVREWDGFADFLADEFQAAENLDAQLHPPGRLN